MNPVLPEEAVALRDAAGRAFAAFGGVDLARRAEADPSLRAAELDPALDALGVDAIDPRAGGVELAAAAALCEAAGRVALPHPLAAALVRDEEGRPTAALPTGAALVDHGDRFEEWRVATLDGRGGVAAPKGSALGTRLGPFVVEMDEPSGDPAPQRDVLLQQTLVAWTVLGTVDRAVQLAVAHVNDRIQFGQPLSAFQAVRFQLADAAVAVAGLRELAGFTLWRLDETSDDIDTGARPDVLALRLHAIEVAATVLRTAQQLHGAAGVCDEYDVSVLTRMVQPALRLPCGVERTAEALADTIDTDGFVGLFPHGADLRAEGWAR